MSAAILVLVAIFIFVSAYFSYGNFLEKKFLIDEKNETPAHANADGVDYIPAKKPVLFGHHFASIAGVGPIVGPVLAVMFGWTPVYLWILIGAVFFGGVHDYSSMVASIRHKGKSIGAILEIYMGEKGKRFFLIFTWATLILVIAVFMLIITKTFVSNSSVGSSSVFFIFAALIFGLLNNKLNVPLVLNTILGIILLSLSVYLGMIFKIELNTTEWMIILLLYITVASVVPVCILLQPR
ncbi:MAG: carbon starvation protein A, partial [Ignavibacteria bacterium]